jgi:hypothetical protein
MAGIADHPQRAEGTASHPGVEARHAGERDAGAAASLRELRRLERARFERIATRVSALLAAHPPAHRRGRFTR